MALMWNKSNNNTLTSCGMGNLSNAHTHVKAHKVIAVTVQCQLCVISHTHSFDSWSLRWIYKHELDYSVQISNYYFDSCLQTQTHSYPHTYTHLQHTCGSVKVVSQHVSIFSFLDQLCGKNVVCFCGESDKAD